MEDPNNPALGADGSPDPVETPLFGGGFPLEQQEQPPEETLSLEDTPEGDDSLSIVPQGEYRPPVTGEVAQRRLGKILFGLGSEAPSKDEILSQLQSGSEDSLRQSVASAEAMKARAEKQRIIQEKAASGQPVTPEDVAFVGGLAKYEHTYNPETILERKFSEGVINAVQGLNGGTNNPIGQGFRQNPEKTSQSIDFATEMLTRQEIIKGAIEDARAAYDNQSWTGWGVDILKGFVPMYGSVKLGYGQPGNESYLEGSVIRDMVQHFWSMPVDQMSKEFRKYVTGIAKDNPGLARRISEAMLTYTREDQFTDNMWAVADIVGAPGVPTALKLGAKATGKAVEAGKALAGRGVAREGLPAAGEAPRASGWRAREPEDGRPLTREEYDRQRVDRLNELHPEKSNKFTFSNQGTNAPSTDRDMGIPVGGTSGFRIWSAKDAPSGTATHEFRHIMDNANQNIVSGNIASLDPASKKELIEYLERLKKEGKIAKDSRLTDEYEIAQAVIDAAFKDPKGLEKVSVALFDATESLVKKYEGLNQSYQEYLANRAKSKSPVTNPTDEAPRAVKAAPREFTTRPDQESFMKELGASGKLTADEEAVIQRYADGALKKVTGEVSNEDFDKLQKISQKFKAPYDFIVYRGAGRNEDLTLRSDEVFTPTSLRKDWAGIFAEGRWASPEVTQILVPKGTPLIPVYKGDLNEMEILLPKGTKWKEISKANLSEDFFEQDLSFRRARVLDPTDEALKATVRANADAVPDLPKMLNDLGDARKASEVSVLSRKSQTIKENDPTGVAWDIINRIPDFLRPDSITRGSTVLSAERAGHLMRRMDDLSATIAEAQVTGVKVGRAPDEVYREILEKESIAFRNEVATNNRLEDAILGVKPVMPSETIENVASLRVSIGTTDKALFETPGDAAHAANSKYRLAPKTYYIRQEGTGYVISIEKTIDETAQGFRTKINTQANTMPENIGNTFLGFLRSADDRVPKFQVANRLATVHGRSVIEKAFRDMRNEIGRMSQKATDEVAAVMNADKHEIPKGWVPKHPDETPPRGIYRNTFGEFEEAFMDLHKKLPTEQQIKSYFIAKELQDWDYIGRNLGVYRDRARLGYQTVTLSDDVIDPQTKRVFTNQNEFVGKKVTELPYNSAINADVVVHNSGKDPIRASLHGATPQQKAEFEKLLKEGYSLIKVENPVRVPFSEKLGADPAHYIITKDANVRPLDPVQIPYRPGWHADYDYNFYVKAPVIREAGGQELEGGLRAPKRNIYEGDKTFTGHTSRAEAKLLAENLEKARQMLLAGGKGLDEFADKNLPMTGREFRRLYFRDDGSAVPYNINAPWHFIENGKTISDDYGKQLAQTFPGFEDAVRSPHNDFANLVDKKFLGQRNDPLQTVEAGNGKPFLRLTEAAEVDPFQTLQNTMHNIIRNRHFADYKISHVEGWVNQFGHLLDAPMEDVLANPVWHIHNTSIKSTPGNMAQAQAAEVSRKALQELIGTPGYLEQRYEALKLKVIDSVYELNGKESAEKLNSLIGPHSERDPVKVMRATAFHSSIGLFNPAQLVQNAMTMTHAIAIGGPVHGFSGAAASWPMRFALNNPGLADKFARWSTAYGWKPEWFKESLEEFKRSGRHIIEGEHTWKDDLTGMTLLQTRRGEFLDMGLVFFKEGERLARLTAWNVAFREWRSANPTKALSDEIRREIMARSDIMTANMTRASNASWQQGVLSIPAQFMSYWTRLSEQMLGKRLTPAEKARIMGFNSMLYGVPIGLTGAASIPGAIGGAGQIPWHETIREAMLSRGMDPNNLAVDAFNSGVTGLIGRMITGDTSDIAAKVGPGGGMLLKNLFFEDKKAIDILFGASGQKGGGIWESLDPAFKAMASPFRADENEYPFKPEDLIGIIRNVKSVDSSLAILYAYNTGLAYAKNGQTIGDMNVKQAIFQMVTGASPKSIADMYLLADANKDRKELVRKVTEVASRDGDALAKAIISGDDQLVKQYQQRIAAHMNLAKLTPSERGAIFQQMANKHKDKINQVRFEYYIKNTPADRTEQRQDYFLNQGGK